ncbi:MAG TPA: AsmA-like C-terminal region-containing protein [Candidatus Sulfotelmatobacter sp.]|nr:AsmA-like C-terminal region-containing protein [Candidatus Sulfotelmatobacter sp.]
MTQNWRQESRGSFRKIVILTGIVGAAAICAIVVGLIYWWPFAQIRVIQDLREASDSQVQIRAFHQTYFPAPGCILEGVVFRRGSADVKPLITIEKLTILGSYPGLLAQRVSRLTAEGLRISIPPFGTAEPFHTTPSKITVDEIVANGSAIEFALRDPAKQSLRFDIHEALLREVGWKGPLTYQVKVHNPEPPGEVTARGKFGVWNRNDPGETPISGNYNFDQADLSVYEGIAGKVSSTGKFSGKLAHIDISGVTDTPDFEVKSGGHPVRLTTEFSAYVDAIHGDTFLKRVQADFLKTRVVAQGSVAGSSSGTGKTALIDLSASNARIEDFLRLFVTADRPPMSGSVTLQSRLEIPPGDQDFLKKVKLQGGFGVAGGTFSDPSTQQGVDKLSAGARGEKNQDDPETALTGLKGQVNLLAGTARLSDLSFGVPGAAARLHGTYNLINYKIDLRGQMRVDTEISKTTSGSKAVLLKMMNPFFKKTRKGEVVPVRISGTYAHPIFGLDFDDKRVKTWSSH